MAVNFDFSRAARGWTVSTSLADKTNVKTQAVFLTSTSLDGLSLLLLIDNADITMTNVVFGIDVSPGVWSSSKVEFNNVDMVSLQTVLSRHILRVIVFLTISI